MEANHEFTLVLADISDFDPSIVDALFEAGCDDATISKNGDVVSMDFDRSAPNMGVAVTSAIADVQKAGMRVARVENEKMAPLFNAVNSALQILPATKQDPSIRVAVAKILDYAVQG